MSPLLVTALALAPSADAFPPIDLAQLPAETRETTTDRHGTKLPVCVAAQLDKLRKQVDAVLARADVDPAWHVVYTFLCGHSPASLRWLRWHMPERVAFTEFTGEGDDLMDFSWRARADVVPALGLAWDAHVNETSTPREVSVSYHTGGECFAYLELRKTGKAWLVVKAGDGCI